MVRIECPDTLNGYLLKISFRRWAKLWSVASLKLFSLETALGLEKRDLRLAECIQAVPWAGLQSSLIHKRYAFKKRIALRNPQGGEWPNCFLIECYNPNPHPVSATLTIRRDGNPMAFQYLADLRPGFNRQRVPLKEIEGVIDLSEPFYVDLTPNDTPEGLTLYFGALDFVFDAALATKPKATPDEAVSKPQLCKCVVWDLDNTLWDGILIEDGAEKVRLKPRIPQILRTLDERGILISAVSKNNHDDALALLRQFGIEEYFLFPQISWNPKSAGIQEVAKCLNIGIDSLLFVDDSRFEREQVKAVCSEVMVLDAADYWSIPDRPDCQSPVTEESKKRRLFYRDQQVRDAAQKDYVGDYLTFLRGCDLHLTIRSLSEANLERVHELTQRTNQMNFSGNRYTRDQLHQFLINEEFDTYVLDCRDRFGSYGTIGFCIVHRPEVRMTDLMFSCRIQAKRVEHAFLSHIIRKCREIQACDFAANYRKTKKNAGPGTVFQDFGFQSVGESNGITRLVFPRQLPIPNDGLVAIEDSTDPALTRA
jgi:FkbH-like protein